MFNEAPRSNMITYVRIFLSHTLLCEITFCGGHVHMYFRIEFVHLHTVKASVNLLVFNPPALRSVSMF